MGSWIAIGASIRGDAHRRKHWPNQDALAWTPPDGGRLAVLAVADGHGSGDSFRSDIGARAAVAVATRLVRDFLADDAQAELPPADLKRRAGELLPQRIVDAWTAVVRDDLAVRPITEQERENALRGKVGKGGRDELAYGATLLVAAALDDRLLFLQVGDGDILTVARDGRVGRPIPPDPRLIANETTSLCSPSAEREFRVESADRTTDALDLVLVSSDGYSNAFVDDASFLKVGPDLAELLQSKGPAWVSEHVQDWLVQASQEGSGDDITLGILWRRDGAPIPPVPPAEATDRGEPPGPEPDADAAKTEEAVRRPGRSLRSVLVPVGLAAAAVAGFFVGSVLAGGGEERPTTVVAPTAPAQPAWIWAGGTRVVKVGSDRPERLTVPALLGKEVVGAVPAANRVWVATADGSLYGLDQRSPGGAADTPIRLPARLAGIAVFGGRLWLSSSDGTTLFRVDPQTRRIETLPLAGAGTTTATPPPPSPLPTASSPTTTAETPTTSTGRVTLTTPTTRAR